MIPGISPLKANSLKHKRHNSNFLNTARGRPHNRHRVRCLTLNFFDFLAFATVDFFANGFLLYHTYCLKGMPKCLNNARPISSVWAEVTKVMDMPLIFSTLL